MPDPNPKGFPTGEKFPQNIQDSFLNQARKEKTSVTIHLMGGVKLSGKIKSFDKFALVMEINHQEQLIFKHAISTVVVSRSTQPSSQSSKAPEA